ncbi:MAG: universal stress protein [Saprospiraceae bacterium]|nr:universal stress protein [Saprospiraceae bacterium]MCB9320216.1 universal stress protein [Lewinellaceae bacterium]
MKKIILLTDFSWDADHAIEYAMQWFSSSYNSGPLDFILVHVAPGVPAIPTYPFLTSMVSSDDLLKEETEQLHAVCAHFSTKFPHFKFRELLVIGEAAKSICTTIHQEHPDLVVMGTKGFTGLTRMIMGSTALEVMRKAQCKMLIVPSGATLDLPRKVVIGANHLAPDQLHVLNPVKDMVEAWNPELEMVRVVTPRELDDIVDEVVVKRVEHFLNSKKLHFTTLQHVSAEDGLEEFIESEKANLLVLIGQERGYLLNLIHHSVSKEMIIHARVPVLILHDQDWEELGERAGHDHELEQKLVGQEAGTFID